MQCKYMQHKCQNQATRRVWCPTWVNANEGPMDLCEEHCSTFDETKNPRATSGSFFWGDAADEAFSDVELFIPRTDERFKNAENMLMAGKVVSGQRIGMLSKVISVVDGKVWLGNYFMISRLGDLEAVRERYPKFFKGTVLDVSRTSG